ncbi:hypothetical protein V6615_05650 [Oscillospiraceae bacterium PP1C4]
MKRSNDLQRKNLFCVFMARGFSPEEAVRRAGLGAGDCGLQSAALLGEPKVRRQIAKLSRELAFCAPAVLARAGLERIALGDISDVIRMVQEDEGASLSGAELFNISEIKRPKGGGFEIKFYDRLRALSLLAGLDSGKSETAGSLLSALAQSAASIGGEDNG